MKRKHKLKLKRQRAAKLEAAMRRREKARQKRRAPLRQELGLDPIAKPKKPREPRESRDVSDLRIALGMLGELFNLGRRRAMQKPEPLALGEGSPAIDIEAREVKE